MKSNYILFILLLFACSAPKKATEKEKQYIQALQGKYITPGSPQILTIPGGMVNFVIRDTVKGKDSIINITKPCPPITINVDSLVRKSNLFTNVILGKQSSDLELSTVRADNQKLQNRNTELKKWLNLCIKILGGIGIVLAAYIFGRIKKII